MARKARKYGKKASEKIERTMREWKRGELRTPAGKKVTSREQAIAIGLAQARRAGYKVPSVPRDHATMYGPKAREKVARTMREFERGELKTPAGKKVTSREQAIAIGLAQARRAGYKVPALSHATKKYPYIGYFIRTRGGPRSEWDIVPVYVLGTTTRADEGIVGHDLRVRPLRLGKGPYTTVVSPDDVEDEP